MALPSQRQTMEVAGSRAGMPKMASLVSLHLGSSMGKLEGLHVASAVWLGSLRPWSPGLLE